MTYAAALAIERWPAGGARVMIPRTRLEVEAGMRREDSWYVARERGGWNPTTVEEIGWRISGL